MDADLNDDTAQGRTEIRQAEFRATVLTKLAALEETMEKVITHMEAIFKRLGQGDVAFAAVERNERELHSVISRVNLIEASCLECKARRRLTWAAVLLLVSLVGIMGGLIGHFMK